MYLHYLRLALKRIVRYKLYSLISIASLAMGLTASILILTFVKYESSFDSMHPRGEDIYRLNWVQIASSSRFATFFNPLSPVLDEGMAEIEAHTRLALSEHVLTVDGAEQLATLSMVDASFFAFFSYPPLAGDPAVAIADAGSIVLTAAAAERLFGKVDVIGETITVDGAHDFRVAAVVANNPGNSHLGSNIFVNIGNLPALWDEPEVWSNVGSDRMYHYVRLAPGSDAVDTAEAALRFLGQAGSTEGIGLILQPLREIHFTPDLQNEMPVVDDMLGTAKTLRRQSDMLIFGAVGLLTLLIATLNFMNMRTVQFSKQAREVAVRRIAGSSDTAVALQLLGETVLMALFALLLALPLCELLLPYLNGVLGTKLASEALLSVPNVLLLSVFAAGVGLAAGLYPSWSAARLSPVAALRGEMLKGRHAARLRGVLIVLQFTISIGLIIASFVVKDQIDYAFARSPGFDPAGVVKVELPNAAARAAFSAMRSQLLTAAGVEAVSAGTTIPTGNLSDGSGAVRVGSDSPLNSRRVLVSEDYFDVLGMEFAAGRALSERFGTDRKPPLSAERPNARGGMVLNETAARMAGWTNPQDAVGGEFYELVPVNGATWRNDLTVVGVVKDAHYGSIRREVEPVVYMMLENYAPNVMVIRARAGEADAMLDALAAVWNRNVPGHPLEFSFLEDDFSALYAGEERTFGLFIALTMLAILIACSGLYGLVSWLTERRTKEIGVRKVLGSGVWKIVLLITNDYSRLVLASNLIAWPLAYIAMSNWLSNFAYRIDLGPVVFIGSGLIALCVAWVTVGGIAAKAASAKPVLALRYE